MRKLLLLHGVSASGKSFGLSKKEYGASYYFLQRHTANAWWSKPKQEQQGT